jgi:hypothetical protein
MAEILVVAVSGAGSAPGTYKRGDCVVVMPDGHAWGSMEGLPRFYVARFPNVPVQLVEDYIAEWRDGDNFVTRREWVVDLDLLPATVLNKLDTQGFCIVRVPEYYNGTHDITWNDLRKLFRNKRTGATA